MSPALLFLRVRSSSAGKKGIEFVVTANNRIFHFLQLLRESRREIQVSERTFFTPCNNHVDFYVALYRTVTGYA